MRWSVWASAMAVVVVVVATACSGGSPTSVRSGGPAGSSTTATPSPNTTGPPATSVPPATTAPASSIPDGPATVWKYAAGVAGDPARHQSLDRVLGMSITLLTDAPASWTADDRQAPTVAPADARDRAIAVWRAAGFDPSGWTVTVNGPTVTGAELFDGVASPLTFTVSFGAGGRIVRATGHLNTPVNAGDFPRISPAAALAAHASGGQPGAPVAPIAGPIGTPSMTRPEPTVVDPLPAPTSTPAFEFTTQPALLAESGLDASVWLVPAYAVSMNDGGHVTVPAVDDSFVRAAPSSGSLSTVPPDANAVVGMTEADAKAAAAQHGWTFRVAVRDGQPQLLTDDHVPTRVNVALESGVVIRAWFG